MPDSPLFNFCQQHFPPGKCYPGKLVHYYEIVMKLQQLIIKRSSNSRISLPAIANNKNKAISVANLLNQWDSAKQAVFTEISGEIHFVDTTADFVIRHLGPPLPDDYQLFTISRQYA